MSLRTLLITVIILSLAGHRVWKRRAHRRVRREAQIHSVTDCSCIAGRGSICSENEMQAAAKIGSEVAARLGPISQGDPACEGPDYPAILSRGTRSKRDDY